MLHLVGGITGSASLVFKTSLDVVLVVRVELLGWEHRPPCSQLRYGILIRRNLLMGQNRKYTILKNATNTSRCTSVELNYVVELFRFFLRQCMGNCVSAR